MASDIWNPNDIKNIAGGWDDDEEKAFFKNEKDANSRLATRKEVGLMP